MKIKSSFLQTVLIASALAFAGCEVGPDYTPPDVSVSDGWNAAQQTETKAEIDQQWWKNFNDPVLSQLIDKAAAQNFDLQIAEARIGEARATLSSATADLLPKGDVKGTATREANQIAFPDQNQLGQLGPLIKKPFNQYQTGFDASWELDIFGGLRRGEEEAEAQMQASEASRDDVRISLMAEVARTYVDIRAAQAQLEVAQETLDSDKHSLSIATQRYNGGDTSRFDMTQAEAEVQNAETNLPDFRNQLAQAEYSMDVLLGEQPGATQSLITGVAPVPVSDKQIVLSAPASVIAQRPDIRVAERRLAAMTAQQGVAVAKFFPDISINGFYGVLGTTANGLISPGNQSWLATGSVIWPILDYGHLSANLDQADAQQHEALANYRKTILTALSDVNKSLNAYNEQQKFLVSAENEVEKDKHARSIAEERYKGGLTNYTDVLITDRTTYEAQNKLALARAHLAQDLIALYKSLGGGWVAEDQIAQK